MDSEPHLEILLAYELAADGLCAQEVAMSFRQARADSPRTILFRRDSRFPAGHYWQVPDCELRERANEWLADERRAFGAFAPRLAARLMRDSTLELDSIRLEWAGLVGPGQRGPRESSFAVRRPGLALETPLYEYIVEPWTADLRYGLLASEPLPFEPVTRLRRRKQARTVALVESDSLAYLSGFGARD